MSIKTKKAPKTGGRKVLPPIVLESVTDKSERLNRLIRHHRQTKDPNIITLLKEEIPAGHHHNCKIRRYPLCNCGIIQSEHYLRVISQVDLATHKSRT
jgi:hypothetical protein